MYIPVVYHKLINGHAMNHYIAVHSKVVRTNQTKFRTAQSLSVKFNMITPFG